MSQRVVVTRMWLHRSDIWTDNTEDLGRDLRLETVPSQKKSTPSPCHSAASPI